MRSARAESFSSRPSAESSLACADEQREPPLANQQVSSTQTLVFDDNRTAVDLYGPDESNLRLIEAALGVDLHCRGNEVRLTGGEPSIGLARKVLEELYACLQSGQRLQEGDVREAVRLVSDSPDISLRDVYGDQLHGVGSRRRLYAKNLSQRLYLDLMQKNDVVMAIGPAGTGKTYLAMAMAVAALNRQEVVRLILTRPAVEAGEKLGFLPGDMVDKVDPYMRPLYDALHDMMDFNKAGRLIDRSVIEVAPLAFMRGRTLNDAFVILDEAQNTTSEQMKMFLTRLGFNSKAVITGDVTQIDLPANVTSGLVEAHDVLAGVEGIGTMEFTKADVVRHPLVQSIISAYEQADERKAASRSGAAGQHRELSQGE
jgi:phosphate starvation-inducible PhoH-like protein